jgi:predicted restriction endonuclease
MYDGNNVHHYQAGMEYLEDLLSWKDVYGPKPTLKVHTDWPEKIVDSQQAWNVVHAGPSPDIKIRETMLCNQFNNSAVPEHVFYVTTPRRLDVTELLSWVNLKSTSYISVNWEFALITPGKEYRSYLFDLSYI